MPEATARPAQTETQYGHVGRYATSSLLDALAASRSGRAISSSVMSLVKRAVAITSTATSRARMTWDCTFDPPSAAAVELAYYSCGTIDQTVKTRQTGDTALRQTQDTTTRQLLEDRTSRVFLQDGCTPAAISPNRLRTTLQSEDLVGEETITLEKYRRR